MYYVSGRLEERPVAAQNKDALRSLRYHIRVGIMETSLLFSLRRLYFALFSAFFQVSLDLSCNLQVFIFGCICDNIKLVHLRLPQSSCSCASRTTVSGVVSSRATIFSPSGRFFR